MKNLPFWMPRKNNLIWYILFTFLFLLSLDFWQWNNYNPIYFGMPIWLIYFLILTMLTSFTFYLFAKYYWSDYSD
jgi:hypothetical protein